MNAPETSIVAAAAIAVLPAIGAFHEGGYYAGHIRTAEGTFGIVVAPRDQGELPEAAWGQYVEIDGAGSYNDGRANTAAMAGAGSTLGAWAAGLAINGFTDWYLPSRDELEIVYRAFKPTAEENYCYRSGENPSAVPPTHAYTPKSPGQTPVEVFKEGGDQAFAEEAYWSSTQCSRDTAWTAYFDGGYQYGYDKSAQLRARAVRRFRIE